jgi:hypothetical protein
MTRGPGFFISPKGEIISVETSHIRTVIKNPDLFGLSRDYIKSKYTKHGEKIGLEGSARTEILRRVLQNGWIRLRRHHNRHWSVQTGTVTEENMGFIQRWAREILYGESGYTENDPYMPVKIMGLEDGFNQQFTVEELARTH